MGSLFELYQISNWFSIDFQDLTACIPKLHDSGVSNPNKTALSGMSAGGLAAAVLCNIEPTLVKAAVLKVIPS